MSKFSKWVKKHKVASAIVNFVRAPDRMLKATTQGKFKKAAGFVVDPWTSNQNTRDMWVRRAGGALSGAAGALITGNPAAVIVGAGIGLSRAGKGHGKLKDYAGSAAIGAGVGLAVTAAPKIYGAASKVLTTSKAATAGKVFTAGQTVMNAVSGSAGSPVQGGGETYYMPPQTPNVVSRGQVGYAETQPERKKNNTALYILGGIGAIILMRSK